MTANENTGTTIIALLGIVITQHVMNWVGFIVGILSGVWVLMQIVNNSLEWNEKYFSKKSKKQ